MEALALDGGVLLTNDRSRRHRGVERLVMHWRERVLVPDRALRWRVGALGESHAQASRIGWFRAAVLGANDGIVSTANLIVGVAAASAAPGGVLISGVAGLLADAMATAGSEYVPVRSQAEVENADLVREKRGLKDNTVREHFELFAVYVTRGLDAVLAKQVAQQRMAHDAHARDELGISENNRLRPVHAALASASSFATGAVLPSGEGRNRAAGLAGAPHRARVARFSCQPRSPPAPRAQSPGWARFESLSGVHSRWQSHMA